MRTDSPEDISETGTLVRSRSTTQNDRKERFTFLFLPTQRSNFAPVTSSSHNWIVTAPVGDFHNKSIRL